MMMTSLRSLPRRSPPKRPNPPKRLLSLRSLPVPWEMMASSPLTRLKSLPIVKKATEEAVVVAVPEAAEEAVEAEAKEVEDPMVIERIDLLFLEKRENVVSLELKVKVKTVLLAVEEAVEETEEPKDTETVPREKLVKLSSESMAWPKPPLKKLSAPSLKLMEKSPNASTLLSRVSALSSTLTIPMLRRPSLP